MGKRRPPGRDPEPEADDPRPPKRNRLISRKRFREFAAAHPATGDLAVYYRWCKIAEQASWRNFADVRATFSSADVVDDLTVFNVGGNKVRVVTRIDFARVVVYIRHVLTHEECDRGRWKRAD